MLRVALVLCIFVVAGYCQIHNVNDHCRKDCTNYRGDKVCANDHKTYDNLCTFSIAACYEHEYHNRNLHVVRRGACPDSFTVRPPVDHCNDLCNEDIEHVCGSDSVVYDNKCKFTRAQCEARKMNQTLFVVASGDVCPQKRTPDCTQYSVDLNDLAIEDASAYRPKCPSHAQYVCGSNGRTYTSECQMCSYMDSMKVQLQVVSDAPCMH